MDKSKWIFAAVLFGVVVVGIIVAKVIENKVEPIKKLANQ